MLKQAKIDEMHLADEQQSERRDKHEIEAIAKRNSNKMGGKIE